MGTPTIKVYFTYLRSKDYTEYNVHLYGKTNVVRNCSTERSLLAKIKSYLRLCSKENNLNSLAIMTIEAVLTSKVY